MELYSTERITLTQALHQSFISGRVIPAGQWQWRLAVLISHCTLMLLLAGWFQWPCWGGSYEGTQLPALRETSQGENTTDLKVFQRLQILQRSTTSSVVILGITTNAFKNIFGKYMRVRLRLFLTIGTTIT